MNKPFLGALFCFALCFFLFSGFTGFEQNGECNEHELPN